MAKKTASSSNLLARLAAEQTIKPGMPAYAPARAFVKERAELLKSLHKTSPGEYVCAHNDLPVFFVAALLDTSTAQRLQGCPVRYDVVLANTLDELLSLHPLWCPAYVRFVECFPESDALLNPCAGDTLDRLMCERRNPLRAVKLALMRKGEARSTIRAYVSGLLNVDIQQESERALIAGKDALVELGRGLAARALLFALLKVPGFRDLIIRSIKDAVEMLEALWGLPEFAESSVFSLIYEARWFRIWGLVQSLVGLGGIWDERFAPRIEFARSRLQLPADLVIPGAAGKPFEAICRDIRDEVAEWYALPDAVCPHPDRRTRQTSSIRQDTLSTTPSAYSIDCEKMALLCNGMPIRLSPIAWNFLMRLAYERGGLAPFSDALGGERQGGGNIRDGRRELGRLLGAKAVSALVVTEKGRGYRLRTGEGGVRVKGLGEVGLVFGHMAD